MSINFILFVYVIISTNNTIQETVITEGTTSISTANPVFPYMSKFISLEYKEMWLKLNEIVLETNIAYKYYSAKNKPTSLWKKLYESLYNSIYGLFSNYKIPMNTKPIQIMKKKLFEGLYPEMKCQTEEMMKNRSTPYPSLMEGTNLRMHLIFLH